MSQPHRRPNLTALDLIRALVPLVVLVLVVVWLSTPSDVDPVREVDPAPALAQAATLADFEILVPVGLPAGWRATSARVDPATSGGPVGVAVGYLTPAERFAQLVQSSLPGALADVLGQGYVVGDEVQVAGRPWRQAQTDDGEQALLRELDGAVVVVTGSAGLDDLRTLAESLRSL